MKCSECVWNQKSISKCEECIHNSTRRMDIPAVDHYNKGDYYIGEKVTFERDGKQITGKIKNFLTKEQAKECNMWYCPLEIELEDGFVIEIADYELIKIFE